MRSFRAAASGAFPHNLSFGKYLPCVRIYFAKVCTLITATAIDAAILIPEKGRVNAREVNPDRI